MENEIFSRKYDVGNEYSISEYYYEKNGEFFQHTCISGHWSGQEKIKRITKADIEKVIRTEQDSLIDELSKLNDKIQELKRL